MKATTKRVSEFKGVFRLLKDVDKMKKGEKFDSFNGLVSGVRVSEDLTIDFTNTDFFAKVMHR